MTARRPHRIRPRSTTPPPDHAEAIVFGWRAHAAQEAWTAKVDVKASIVLALDGVVLAAIISGHNKDGVLAQLAGWRNLFHGIAAVLIFVALVLAGAVVRPALGSSREHKRHHTDHLIYFGHLRHWDGPALAARLRGCTPHDETEQLGEQLVAMSRRNWWKHRFLQYALYFTGASALFLAGATLWPH